MIFYFSGTGNSKWVADEVAQKINEKTSDISALKEVPDVANEDKIGFVFPVYAWGSPEVVTLFAKKLRKAIKGIKGFNAYTFGICTCGADAGKAMKKLSKVIKLDSSYSITMPNNYIIGGDLEEESVVRGKIENARASIAEIAEELTEKKKVYRVHEGKSARLKSGLVNMGFNKFARTTKPFFVEKDKCNGCGLCAVMCPASTIKMVNGNPEWNKKCYQCLRCINYCPQCAVQYGKKTVGRKRYNIEKYL